MMHDPIPVPTPESDTATATPIAPVAAGNAAMPLHAALAEELRIASRLLNDLAYELACDNAVIRKHVESLQNIDRVTQMQLSVASILDSGHTDAAQVFIGLEDMADRLREACRPETARTGIYED